ncbi:unnamed protein product [Orchesella dallaii]|uniref:Uncharacterized protein n=1 Tax=Orchesella dallaii TaxID=48710 RepID=A0ABP1PZU3_9HEXA
MCEGTDSLSAPTTNLHSTQGSSDPNLNVSSSAAAASAAKKRSLLPLSSPRHQPRQSRAPSMDWYFKDLIQSSINPARTPEERDPWNELLLNFDAVQIDVPLIQPEINEPEPEIDVPEPEIHEPQPEINEPQPEINEPQPEINAPEPREPVAQPAIPYPEVPKHFELPYPSYDGQQPPNVSKL